jgi:hypothetical protein
MLRRLPIGLIVLSLLSTSSFAGSGAGSGSGPAGNSYSPGSGSGSGSKSGSGWGSGSRDDEFNYYRIDCRYHGDDQDDHGSGSDHGSDSTGGKPGDRLSDKFAAEKGKVYGGDKDYGGRFCYGSAVYRITDREVRDIHLAIGCNNRTIFNEEARLHAEATLDRFQPLRAATPAIEVFPHGQLGTEGTYTSVLDISYGRMKGLCYVHSVKYDDIGKKY